LARIGGRGRLPLWDALAGDQEAAARSRFTASSEARTSSRSSPRWRLRSGQQRRERLPWAGRPCWRQGCWLPLPRAATFFLTLRESILPHSSITHKHL
jgi:hypothetical protein